MTARHPQWIGDPGYDQVSLFAKLGPHTYGGARLGYAGELTEVQVAGLAIVRWGESTSTGGRQSEDFRLVELDGNGEVIDDWVEATVDEAKEHGEARTNVGDSGLDWQPVPDGDDLRRWVRAQLAEG